LVPVHSRPDASGACRRIDRDVAQVAGAQDNGPIEVRTRAVAAWLRGDWDTSCRTESDRGDYVVGVNRLEDRGEILCDRLVPRLRGFLELRAARYEYSAPHCGTQCRYVCHRVVVSLLGGHQMPQRLAGRDHLVCRR